MEKVKIVSAETTKQLQGKVNSILENNIYKTKGSIYKHKGKLHAMLVRQVTPKKNMSLKKKAIHDAISECFTIPKDGSYSELTNTEIQDKIYEQSNQKVSKRGLGRILKDMGFEQKHVRDGTSTKRVYLVSCLTQNQY